MNKCYNTMAIDKHLRESDLEDKRNDWINDKAVDLLSCESDRLVEHLNNEVIKAPDYCDEIAEILKLCVKHVDSMPLDIQELLEQCADKAAEFEHDNQ